jgi:acylphosphatase
MNLADGRVRVVAEGSREAIEALVRALQTGPRLARVEEATVTWNPPSERFSGFGIRHGGDGA